ncbi:MAG: DUF4124 domain-containing protein [Pseudomonadota bacterium]
MKMYKRVLTGIGAALLVGVSFAADTATQVFRSVDAQGNVVFSDTPREGAKPMDVQQPSSVQAIAPPTSVGSMSSSASSQGVKAPVDYQALVITQPADGAALNNTAGDVDVSVNLIPELRADLGHGLSVTMDGKLVLQNSARLNFTMTNVDRGEHVLEAFVVNAAGQVLFMSAPVRFSLQRTSVFLPGRANHR